MTNTAVFIFGMKATLGTKVIKGQAKTYSAPLPFPYFLQY